MNLRTGLLTCCLLLVTQLLPAQQTTVFTEATLSYKRGVDFFDQGLYGLAQKEFQEAITQTRPVNEAEWRDIKINAELYFAKCAVRLNQPEAEKLVLDFLRDQAPSPIASQAALEIGDYYFDKKSYDEALIYYDMAPDASGYLREEIRFKQAYSYFVTKRFGNAKTIFASLKENPRGKYYEQSNYYYGCCAFYENRYDEAQKAFLRAEKSDKYKQVVPYYLVQIMFAKKQYDEVIKYAEPKAKDPNQKNRAEINQLVGQSYFEKGDFKRAQPYLEFAANNGVNFRPSDYYQLGYTQYQNGFYKLAIDNFEQLSKQDSVLGQNGLYHLGDCYIRTGNKFAARNAFGQAASLNYDKTVKEDALINYAKLSYELKFDSDALAALQRITPASPYYADAQALMGEIFLNTRDYDRAITTLESSKNRTPRLNEILQKVCYLRGLQLYQSSQTDEARRFFNKSLDNPIDKRIATLSSYWLGTIAHEKGDYKGSQIQITAFLNSARNYSDLPEESSLATGQYLQGYNLLKQKEYANALTFFKQAVDGIKRNQSRSQNDQINSGVLGDAVLRSGDCHFKRNQYNEALSYYNEAISRKYTGFEYAMYQRAIIKGLQGNNNDKIEALDDLVQKYPNSQYTDEALYELGSTYQNLNKSAQAISYLKRIVQDFRGKSTLVVPALLRLGLISYNDGSNANAINYYKQVFSNNPENDQAKEALSSLEIIYKEMNRPDEYFSFLETVPGYKVSAAGKDSVTYEAAEYQFERGQYQMAAEGFTSYLTKYPSGRQKVSAYFYRGESYLGLNKFPESFKDYATVTSLGTSRFYSKAAEKGTIIAFNSLKDYPQTLEMARKWEESATTAISRLDAQTFAMRAAYQTNNSVAVQEYATKVLSGGSDGEQAALANFYLGKLAYDRGDNNTAQTRFQQVIQMTQTEAMAESYHYLCQILYRQRKYTEAEDMVSKANQSSAGYDDWIARNLILLSDVYLDQGDRNSALAALEGILENYTGSNQKIKDEANQKYQKLGGTPPASTPQGRGIKKQSVEILDLDNGN